MTTKRKRGGQPPVANPRRRKINVLLTDDEAARLDELRGAVPAGAWIRLQIMPALKGMFSPD